MTYLESSQAYLEQSAQLLEAYPETTRITTKYNFPTERPAQVLKRTKSQAKSNKPTPTPTSTEPPAAPIASLTLKTFCPESGITIQYRTNKHQEVGRLMTGLGKLAAGADVASLGLSAPGVPGADVEMVDAPEEGVSASAPAAAAAAAAKGQQAQGGKGKKKKGGKGK